MAQTDNCVISSVPVTWDFESDINNDTYPYPNCWMRTGTIWMNLLPEVVRGYPAHSGSYVLESSHETANTYAILPYIEMDSLNINELQISFYVKSPSYDINPYDLTVGVMSNPDDVSTFIELYRIYCYDIDVYRYYAIPFSGYTGTGAYIAFRFDNTCIVDDITVEYIDTCPSPSLLSADSVTETSVSLSWIGPDSLSANYILYYRSVVDTIWDSVAFTAIGPHYILDGLEPSTSYEVCIVSDCHPDLSSNIVCFTTECVAISTFPRFWDFEYHYVVDKVFANEELPDCWEGNIAYLTGFTPHSFTNLFEFSSTNSIVFPVRVPSYFDHYPVPVAVLPQIDTNYVSISQLQLSFNVRTNAPLGYPVAIEVGVKNDSNPLDSMVVVQTITNVTNEYQRFDIPFSSYLGNGNFIAIRNVSAAPTMGSVSVYMDDMILDFIPDCPRPSNLTVQQLTETSVTLGWVGHNTSQPAYTCYFRPVGDTLWSTEVFNTAISSHILSNLRHSTEYELYLVNNCDTMRRSEILKFNTLCGDIAQVPYGWDFEQNNTAYPTQYVLPACWNRSHGSYPYVVESGPVQERGRMLYFHNNSPSTVVLPRINTDSLSFSDLQISFSAMATEDYVYNEMNWATLTIGVMTDPDSADSFIPVYQITDFSTTFQEYSIPLANYAGSGAYIAIRNAGSYHTFIYLDDLILDTIPDCPRPSALSASHPTAHTITLHWTGYDETNGQLLLYYRETGDPVWYSNTVSITGNSFMMSGLSAHTSYQAYLAATCDPTLTSNVIVFSTLCEAFTTVPQLWDFEENNTAEVHPLPECWSRTGDYYPHVVQNNATNPWAYTGTHYLSFLNSAKSTVVLPAIDTSILQINNLMVSFYAKTNYASDNNRLLIGVMSDPTDTSTFVAIDTVSGFTIEHQVFDVPLSPYIGDGVHIGIRTFGSASNMIYIDDLSVLELPECSRPANFTVVNLDVHSATLAWECNADSTWYIIAYKSINSDTVLYDTTEVLHNPQVTLAGLEAITTYEVRVAANCYPDAFSSPIVFTTLCSTIDSLPAFWDFEEDNNGGTSSKPLPTCWGRVTSGSNSDVPYVYTSTYYSYSGSKALDFWRSRGWYVTMPALSDTIPVNQLGMTFYLKCHTLAEYAFLEVGVMTDPNDISTFTVVDTLKNMTTDYQFVELDFYDYNGNGRFIAFHDISSSGATDIFIDDLTLLRMATCPRPTDIFVLNVTGRTADVMWTHDADSTEYVIFSREVGSNLWETDTVNITAYTLDNLIPGTTYDLYVVALCNPDNPTEVITFTTECVSDINAVPQTWGFEDATLNEMQPCWTRIVGSDASDPNFPCVENSHPQSGNKSLRFWHSGGNMAIMPYVNSNYLDIRTLQISFYIYNHYGDQYAAARLEVGVMTDPTDPSSFTLVQTLDSLQQSFVYVSVPFFEYEGEGTYIAFRDPNPNPNSPIGYAYDIYIDSLTIDQNYNIPCPIPSQLEVSDITDSSAVVTWQASPTVVTTYLVYYRPSADMVWQVDTSYLGAMTHTLQHLESETSYDCYVVSVCDSDTPSEIIHFETETHSDDSVGIENLIRLGAKVLLYPNPAREFVDVRVTDSNINILSVEIYDVYGKIVRTIVGANNDLTLQTTRINVSGLGNGAYFVRVRTDKGIVTKKVVKIR